MKQGEASSFLALFCFIMVARREFNKEERHFLVCQRIKRTPFKQLLEAFHERFPHAPIPSRQGIRKMVIKFETCFDLATQRAGHSGRKRSGRSDQNIALVKQTLEVELEYGPGMMRSSTRRNNIGISAATFSRIVKKDLKLHPYRLRRNVFLSERAKHLRLHLCNYLVKQPPLYFKRLIVSDEATFILNGHVFNRKTNVCYSSWRKGQPKHFFSESTQRPPKVMVFLLIVGDGQVFGPYFYGQNESINAQSYQKKLEKEVFPDFCKFYGNRHFRRLTFMQDGASPHMAKQTMAYLNSTFGKRLLALKAENGQEWAPSSPDLSALDFSVWAEVKRKVYTVPLPTTIEELKAKITATVKGLSHNYIEKCMLATKSRAQRVIAESGSHI